jgi:hypothetical protein
LGKPSLKESPVRNTDGELATANSHWGHALGDPVEVKTFCDDLIATGHDLGVSMPMMESYAEAITRFANTAQKNVKTD